MAPKIYTSPFPATPLYNQSVFTYLFSSASQPNSIGGYDALAPAFIDAPTGTSISRAQLKQLALTMGYGLRNHPSLSAKRGDTVLIYSQNSLSWPVVLFGAGKLMRPFIPLDPDDLCLYTVAAGLRCTLANNAYNARELAFQYTDSKAKVIFSSEDGVATVRETLKSLGLSKAEADQRIVVLTNDLQWAGGPSTSRRPEHARLLTVADLLKLGSLKEEEKFDGELANETVYLCYSSGSVYTPSFLRAEEALFLSVPV